MRIFYLIDSTECGFFTAVFDGYKDENAFISSNERNIQPGLEDKFKEVISDKEKAARVIKKLRALDNNCLFEIDRILRTPYEDREQVAFLYIRGIVKAKKPIRERLILSEVRIALNYAAQVGNEIHRLKGFIRFHETSQGFFYAAFSPDNDVLELIMPHFFARFKTAGFAIHDISRKTVGISDGKGFMIAPAGEADVVFSQKEDYFLSLWKKYYHTVYIPSRKNTKQMKGYMPVRYWKFLPEKIAEDEELIAAPFQEKVPDKDR